MPATINHFFTSNFLKVIYAQDNTSPLVSLQLNILTGAGFEAENEAGYSHLLEHLVFKSTEKYPNNTLMDAVAMYGGNINAYTDHESTCFYINLPSEFLNEGIAILAELAVKANFNKTEFLSEKNVVIEEIKQYKNDPEDYFIENIPSMVLGKHPYALNILGNTASLKRAKIDELQTFYRKHYTAQNAFLCVAGDFEVDQLQEACEHLCLPGGDLVGAGMTAHSSVGVDYQSTRSDLGMGDQNPLHFPLLVENDMLAFVLPYPADNHPAANRLLCLEKIFVSGRNSRLYQRLFIKEKLIDNIKAQSVTGKYDGVLIMLITPRKNEYIPKIIEIFTQEMNILNVFGVYNSEVDDVKKELLHASRYIFEYMETLAQTIASEEILGDYHTFFNYEADIQAITTQNVNLLIAEYFNPNKLTTIVGGKKKRQYPLTALFAKTPSAPPAELQIQQTTLPNGLKVLLKKTAEDKHICGVTLAVYASQLNETETTLGLNQLTTNALLFGNQRRDYRQCLQYCTTNGIQFSISNGKETTRFSLKCFNDNIFEALQLLFDVLYTPTFPEEHIQNLKQTYISNIQKTMDYPHSEAVLRFKRMLLGSSSHLLDKSGTVKTISSFTKNKVVQWYQQHILQAPATLCIMGDIDVSKTMLYIQHLFGVPSFDTNLVQRPIIYSPCNKRKVVFTKKLDQSILNLGGFCMPGNRVNQRAPMNVLSQIIGGEVASRMFTLLRERYAIAYSAEFDYDMLTDIGYYDMFTIVDRQNERMAIQLLYHMLVELRQKGVTTDEIEKAKRFLIGQLKMDNESVSLQSQTIASLLTLGMTYEYYTNIPNSLEGVTNEAITQIIEEYFNPEDMYLHILN